MGICVVVTGTWTVLSTTTSGLPPVAGTAHPTASPAEFRLAVAAVHGPRALQPLPEDASWRHAVLTSPGIAPVPLDALVRPEPIPPQQTAREVVVGPGDTLLGVLAAAGVAAREADVAVAAFADVFDPRRLRVGQRLAVEMAPADGALRRLTFRPDDLETIELVRTVTAAGDVRFDAQRRTVELVAERAFLAARVERSIDAATRRAGAPPDTAAHLAKLFDGHVDFRRETRTGDELTLWYDQLRAPDGGVLRIGDIHYARAVVGGRVHEAFRFEVDGRAVYFDRDGRSLEQLLLRQPIAGHRVSSGFGMRRHPLLGYRRMHTGIDFAAPKGTPIHAAGAGKLVQVGRNGGYGHYVRIDHGNGYQTAYAHLSRYAGGITAGGHVRQGQVIGHVGSTGVSTGPHLHFEVIKNGRHVDPLRVAKPPALQLEGARLHAFQEHVRAIDGLVARQRTEGVIVQTSGEALSPGRAGG